MPTIEELDSTVRAFYEGRGEQVCMFGLLQLFGGTVLKLILDFSLAPSIAKSSSSRLEPGKCSSPLFFPAPPIYIS
jgi:hypothetical protein